MKYVQMIIIIFVPKSDFLRHNVWLKKKRNGASDNIYNKSIHQEILPRDLCALTFKFKKISFHIFWLLAA